ncbi:MAG: helix-turn-helix domain-containing protein [Flavisolibacter sp.]|nr:helix-turn-helix domain-containing protein [Flavisolibacter sp.]MBD0331679.1 helix-turn-helix domain-containing protein [Chitinophagaceae bacterium]
MKAFTSEQFSKSPTLREVSYNSLPEQIALLHEKLDLLLFQSANKQEPAPLKKVPVGIDRAYEVTGLARPTIYAMAPKGEIPNFKKGGRLYFYEEDLIKWIESGRRLTQSEIAAQSDSLLINKRNRNKKLMVSPATNQHER